jgi:hypothetical protein
MPRGAVDRLAPRVPGTDVLRNPDGDVHRPFGYRASNNVASVCRTPRITRGRSPSGAFLMLRQLTRLSGLSSHHTRLEQARRPSWPEVGARQAYAVAPTYERMVQLAPAISLGGPILQPPQWIPRRHRRPEFRERVVWSEQTDLQSLLILQQAREFLELFCWKVWPKARPYPANSKVVPLAESFSDGTLPASHCAAPALASRCCLTPAVSGPLDGLVRLHFHQSPPSSLSAVRRSRFVAVTSALRSTGKDTLPMRPTRSSTSSPRRGTRQN